MSSTAVVTETREQQDIETTRDDHGDGPPFHDGVTIGLLCVVGGALGIMAAYGELFADALVFLAVFVGLGIWAARNRSTRLRWVIAGLLTVFLGFNLIYAIGDLSHPESPAPFVTTAIVMGAGVITIVLAVRSARGNPQSGRRVWTTAVLGLGVVAAGSLVVAAGVEDDAAQPGDTAITAEDVEFPAEVVVEPSSDAALIRNADRAQHTFVVDGEIQPVELPADSQVRVELDLAPGTYRYYCDIAGHEDMEGTLVVQ